MLVDVDATGDGHNLGHTVVVVEGAPRLEVNHVLGRYLDGLAANPILVSRDERLGVGDDLHAVGAQPPQFSDEASRPPCLQQISVAS